MTTNLLQTFAEKRMAKREGQGECQIERQWATKKKKKAGHSGTVAVAATVTFCCL